ncbi:hypothetical protein [Phenylobacterium sp.]|jgi:hypothetical protein|uniref:hypothetical protein n=1 Tax=Phenylobacterium sp. TaxID=1871053 RepID=UPI0037C8602E
MMDQEPEGRDRKVQAVALDPADLPEATGTQDRNLGIMLVKQAVEALWAPARMSNADRQEAVNAAVAALKGLAPTDALEGMMATQMVAIHNGAMECLRRAQLEGQSFEGRDQNLKHATKLLATYARHVEALDKHRGRGQQKITVEHVTVNAGGQAIVGNVGAGANSPRAYEPVKSPLALPDDPSPHAQIIDGAQFARAERLKKPIPVRRGGR